MQILPVLDVMRGRVVRAIGGRRRAYRPLVSRLTALSLPHESAENIREFFGYDKLYLADLDAILGGEPAEAIYADLHGRGFRLWVDAGVRHSARVCQLVEAGVESIVVGLETVAGPEELAKIVRGFGARIVFSLDLRQGEPLGERGAWEERAAAAIAGQAVRLGVRRLLVLDLAHVGRGLGTGTRELCAHLKAAYPDVEISAGGGVRNRADLEDLRSCGVSTALVASALHDGRLSRADLDGL